MAAERSTFQWGGTVFPLTTSGGNTSLRDVDPALYYALDFWKSMLVTYAGARWTAECTTLGLTHFASTIVAATIPYDPLPYLTSDQLDFPLLAAYRGRARTVDQSVQWECSDSVWTVDFILPTLQPDHAEHLIPFLNAARAIITNRTTEGFDSLYTPPGASAGAAVWPLANIHTIGVTDSQIGDWTATDKLHFPALRMSLSVIERQAVPAGAFQTLAGTDVQVDVVANDGSGTEPHVADFKT